MDFIEISAKTVEDALTEACLKLGTTSDKLEYEVVEDEVKGYTTTVKNSVVTDDPNKTNIARIGNIREDCRIAKMII